MTPLVLYHNDMSVCAAKVRLVLAEKGLGWESRHLNLRAGEAVTADYLRLNPGGVVPTLIDDGQPVIESTVICEYLDDRFPDVPVRPADPRARARMRVWTRQLDAGLHLMTGIVSTCIAFRHQYLRRTPEELDAYLLSVPDAERREARRQAIQQGMDAPQFRAAATRVLTLLADMAAALDDAPWLAGSTYSLADIALTPYIERFAQLGFGNAIRGHLGVAAWADNVAARANHAEGIGRWINPAYMELFGSVRGDAAAWLRENMDV